MSVRVRYHGQQSPPSDVLGFMRLVNEYGHVVYWDGKRWWDPSQSNGSLQTREAWPPDPNDYGGARTWWAER